MTKTKQLTSAVAFLASIAVLDNFIFVELEPGFESIALIELSGSSIDAEISQTSVSPETLNEAEDFWIDQDSVSSADFAKFLESTDYEPQEVALHRLPEFKTLNGDAALAANDAKWRAQASNTNWVETSDKGSLPINHTLAGQDDLKVSFKDALAYCNWLGKDLPTAEKFEHITMKDHDNKVPGLIEFRCVKNI